MTIKFNKTLVKDMAIKAMEDCMEVFSKNHELIHHGGGNCYDASMAKLIAVFAMQKSLARKLPKEVEEAIAPTIDELVEFIHGKAEEEMEDIAKDIMKDLMPKDIEEQLKKMVARIFGVDEDEITVEQLNGDTKDITDKIPTRH